MQIINNHWCCHNFEDHWDIFMRWKNKKIKRNCNFQGKRSSMKSIHFLLPFIHKKKHLISGIYHTFQSIWLFVDAQNPLNQFSLEIKMLQVFFSFLPASLFWWIDSMKLIVIELRWYVGCTKRKGEIKNDPFFLYIQLLLLF